jgi:broad specificity phosphatase PhoE
MALVVLVRHAQSVWNHRGLVQGQAAAPGLTPRGWAQAAQAAWALRDLPCAAVVSSDLRRARQTAAVLATLRGIDLELDPALRERSLGRAEGRAAPLPAAWTGFQGGRLWDPDAAPPGGESVRQLLARVAPRLEQLARRAARERGAVVVVTHGGVVRAARAVATWGDPGALVPGTPWPVVPNAARLLLPAADLLQAWSSCGEPPSGPG